WSGRSRVRIAACAGRNCYRDCLPHHHRIDPQRFQPDEERTRSLEWSERSPFVAYRRKRGSFGYRAALPVALTLLYADHTYTSQRNDRGLLRSALETNSKLARRRDCCGVALVSHAVERL